MAHPPDWTLEHVRRHIEEGLPLVPLFNLEVVEASPARGLLRLNEGAPVRRPGGSVAGPIQFALADVATYALILAVKRDPAAVTVDMAINFLRPAMTLPLLAEATTLRAGRRLFTADVRISEETSGKLVAQATTTYALSEGSG
ncbi:MAG: PaaI family thioesterase [Rhodospirillales bacterium]|nr:PaaI family thioesterase [Rhodospirillales bacterium]